MSGVCITLSALLVSYISTLIHTHSSITVDRHAIKLLVKKINHSSHLGTRSQDMRRCGVNHVTGTRLKASQKNEKNKIKDAGASEMKDGDKFRNAPGASRGSALWSGVGSWRGKAAQSAWTDEAGRWIWRVRWSHARVEVIFICARIFLGEISAWRGTQWGFTGRAELSAALNAFNTVAKIKKKQQPLWRWQVLGRSTRNRNTENAGHGESKNQLL